MEGGKGLRVDIDVVFYLEKIEVVFHLNKIEVVFHLEKAGTELGNKQFINFL
jgi:hypothetical protein